MCKYWSNYKVLPFLSESGLLYCIFVIKVIMLHNTSRHFVLEIVIIDNCLNIDTSCGCETAQLLLVTSGLGPWFWSELCASIFTKDNIRIVLKGIDAIKLCSFTLPQGAKSDHSITKCSIIYTLKSIKEYSYYKIYICICIQTDILYMCLCR